MDFWEIGSHYSNFNSHEDSYINEQELNQCSELLPATTDSANNSSDSKADSGTEIWDIEADIECEPNENSHKLLYSVSYFLLFSSFAIKYQIEQ